LQFLEQCIGVVSLVGKGGIGLEAFDELIGAADAVFLPRPANQPNRKAQSIACGMDFRA